MGSLDDDGYLRRELSSISDDLAFRQNVMADEQEIEAVIKKFSNLIRPAFAPGISRNACCSNYTRNLKEGKM